MHHGGAGQLIDSGLVRVRLHGDLSRFLGRRLQAVEVGANAGPTDTLKHVIESLGVPHTETAA